MVKIVTYTIRGKTVFSDNMSPKQVEALIYEAYSKAVVAGYNGIGRWSARTKIGNIEGYIDESTGLIISANPVF